MAFWIKIRHRINFEDCRYGFIAMSQKFEKFVFENISIYQTLIDWMLNQYKLFEISI